MYVPVCAFFLLCIFCGQFRPTSAQNNNNFFKNYEEIKQNGDTESGVRTVYPIEGYEGFYSVDVYCEQITDEGGWTEIQKRDLIPDRENFYRSWYVYAKGFGDITMEFWLGLEHIHALTSSTEMELRIDLEDFEGVKRFAKYGTFHVGDNSTGYVLRIGNYSGDAGDGLTPDSVGANLNGMKFSTYDRDNDNNAGGNCAKAFRGAWWFNDCHRAHLNGIFDDGIVWVPFHKPTYSLKKTSMKIRPVTKKEGKPNQEDTTTKEETNCAEFQGPSAKLSGVRTVNPGGDFNSSEVVVYCDQEADGGGWTVIQKRSPLPVRENFTRSWSEYVEGFGNLTGEFWLGLRKIHALTSSTQMELRVDMEDDKGQKRWAKYGVFHVGDAATKYTLRIADYYGTAGDGMTPSYSDAFNLNGMKFTTFDEDNDIGSGNCAEFFHGGWWYNNCFAAHLNGLPIVGEAPKAQGIYWALFCGCCSSLKKARMMIRPVSRGF